MKQLFLATLLLLAGLGAAGWYAVQGYMHSPIPGLSAPRVINVPAGASLNRVAADLADQQILNWPQVFALWGRVQDKARSIKAGEYQLDPGVTPAGILDQLVEGRVKLYSLTLLEGWTLREVLEALAASPAIEVTLDPANPGTAFLVDDPLTEGTAAEGWLYPETYSVPRGTTDAEVLRRANALMVEKLAAAWARRSADLPLKSPYELLILASIIERETAIDEERNQVAGVFIRRLRKGMRLQTDPTVIYGLGDAYDGNLTRAHLLTDTPFNTYTRAGLPPTPIGMPAEASLLAAGHPDDGNALYFVASGEGDGSHVFSATLEEHNAAVAAYIARLRQANRASKGE